MRSLTLLMFVLLLLPAIARPSQAQSDLCGQAPKIAYGETLQGEISDQLPLFWVCFEGQQGDRVVIMMERLSEDLDPQILLTSNDFQNLYVSNDNLGLASLDSRLEYVLPESGDFLITASRRDLNGGRTQGQFQLSLHLEDPQDGRLNEVLAGRGIDGFNACESRVNQIAYGDSVAGEIMGDIPISSFCFQAEAGDRVQIEISATNRSRLIPYLLLTESTLTQNYSANGNLDLRSQAILEYTFSEGDLYLIIATSQANTFGEFELTLTLISTGNLGSGRRTQLDLIDGLTLLR